MVNMDDYIEQAIEILAQLVHFDTTSHKTNLPLIAYIEEILKAASIPYSLIPNDEGDKASLDFTLNELRKIFGSKVDKDLIKSHVVNWSDNPLFLGSWASAEPGAFKYREILRQ